MGKDRFDFSEIDAALPAAERMQEKDRLTDTLENNYKAVGILSDRVEKLEGRLSEVLPGLDEAVSSLREANKITISEEARRTLEQEGEAVCRKMAERIDKESARLLERLSMRDRVVISATAFWCMIEVIVSLLAAFACICMANAKFIHSLMLWKVLGYTAGFFVVCVAQHVHRLFLVGHIGHLDQLCKAFPREWDEKCSEPIAAGNDRRAAIVQSITRKLRSDMERLSAIIERFENLSRNYSSDDVVEKFRRTGKENTLFVFMEGVIERLRQLNHSGTAKNYSAALGSFKRFRNNEDIQMEAIDHILMEDYQAYLASLGVVPNSISFYMRILRAVYNRAVEQELTIDRNPFRTVFTGVEKTRKRAISISDIKRIRDLDLSLKPNLEFARNLFLFLFLCRGMSFIDAAFLKKSDIQSGILTYRRHKTNQVLHIKIIKPIKELVDRYSSNDSPYLLPIITRPHCDERRQYETALRRVNKSLKTIAGMVKLPIPLTTYVSRHAWATIAKSKNIPVNVISDALGHDSIATTQIYLASIDTSTIDRANELIIKDL